VVVEGLNGTGLPDQIYQPVHHFFGRSTTSQAWNFAWFSILGSNVFSNVPFVLVAGKWIHNFAQPDLMWKVMALATTFAGNLTILGSVANIIVLESARSHVEIGFWDYARFGIPVTILTTIIGILILCLLPI
jgi:Na+/H+ antiporter NhaD/arsenite permease-like protein